MFIGQMATSHVSVVEAPMYITANTKKCRSGIGIAKKYCSVKTGAMLQVSNLPLKTWVWAIYLESTSLKGISSMKLHRDLGVTQTAA